MKIFGVSVVSIAIAYGLIWAAKKGVLDFVPVP